MNEKIQQLVKACDRAFNSTERVNQKESWELIAEFILPNQRTNFIGMNTPGEKKTRRLYDNTAIQANIDLAAATHSVLTNPATEWSELRFRDEALNNRDDTLNWLEAAKKAIHAYLNDSNFDTQVSKNYQAYSSLGTMILLHEEINNKAGLFEGFRFEAIHLSEVAIAENKYGIVDQLYRKMKMTGKQILERWSEALPTDIASKMQDKPEDDHEIIVCYRKRDGQYKDQVLAKEDERPFEALYILTKGFIELEKIGYYEFPIYVPRWSTMPGEAYGRGPGHIALPNVRTLNELVKVDLEARSLAANPPWISTQRNILSNLDLRPGGLTIVANKDNIGPLQTSARFDVNQQGIEMLGNSIKATFYIDKLFLPPRTETGEMTAFEIDQRLAQMQRVLGPTLSRLNNEFLSPLIVRCFKILLRANALPPMPQILQEAGVELDIAFVNQLSRAQKVEELQSVQRWLQGVFESAQFKPEMLDYVNGDEVVKFSGRTWSVPENLIMNDDAVAQLRQQRQEAMEAQQAVEQGVGVADIISKTGMNKEGQ